MASMKELEGIIGDTCAERSEQLARLQEEKEKLEYQLQEVDRAMKEIHEELRVGNQLSDVMVQHRERRHMMEAGSGSVPAPSMNSRPKLMSDMAVQREGLR